MKIRIPSLSAAEEEKMSTGTEEESLNEEWQDFLAHVCQSIEERRKLIKPKAFRSKKTSLKS
jgi:hypothetical protein